MLVGFLRGPEEEPGSLGKEFSAFRNKDAVIDLEQFAVICDQMNH